MKAKNIFQTVRFIVMLIFSVICGACNEMSWMAVSICMAIVFLLEWTGIGNKYLRTGNPVGNTPPDKPGSRTGNPVGNTPPDKPKG